VGVGFALLGLAGEAPDEPDDFFTYYVCLVSDGGGDLELQYREGSWGAAGLLGGGLDAEGATSCGAELE
jgi:hypothetical protein